MSTVAVPGPTPVPAGFRPLSYLNARHGLGSWLLASDHKRVAILYLVAVSTSFLIGGLAAATLRIDLLTPNGALFGDPETYAKFFTLHGVVMMYFFLIPIIPTVLGNFILPLMIGAREVAFPRLNLAGFYLYVIGVLLGNWALIYGGVDTGWTFIVPYSTISSATPVDALALAVLIVSLSTMLTGVNFLATIAFLRTPGMAWTRLPLFAWSLLVQSFVVVLAVPVLALSLLLVTIDVSLPRGVFDPAIGGDPSLFQHLFWFGTHPVVYATTLPALGIISEIIAGFSRRVIFGYRGMVVALFALAFLFFVSWGENLLFSGMSTESALFFSLVGFIMVIPFAVKIFDWALTLFGGSVAISSPLLFALGAIVLLVTGGMAGLWLSSLAVGNHLHETYFVVAHFHYLTSGAIGMAFLAGLHYWWPKITGRIYSEIWAILAALACFLGVNATFMPQFLLGYLGVPRRYGIYPPEFQVLNVMSTLGAGLLAVGFALPLVYLFASLGSEVEAGPNPWGVGGLEWTTASPPPPENFPASPTVTAGPYAYVPTPAPVAGASERTS